MSHLRRLAGGLMLVLATLLGVATSAWGYWTSAGTGTGSATTATLNPPTSLTASTTPGVAEVSLTWNTPTGGVSPQGYTVTRTIQPGGVLTAPACGGVTITDFSCTDSPVPAGTYTYTVTAVYASWSTPSAPSTPVIVTTTPVDTSPPTVLSISRVGSSPTNATTLAWTVTFSEAVTGVVAGSFTLTTPGVYGTPAISTVSPPAPAAAATWTVTASTNGATASLGTIRLDLTNPGTIADEAANPLATASFAGEAYTYDTAPPAVAIADVNGASAGFPYSTTGNVNTVGGTCTATDGTVSIEISGSTTLTTTVSCTAGVWTLPTNWTTPGTRAVRATQTDAAGNTGSDLETVVIDRTAPAVIGVTSPLANGTYGIGQQIPITVTFSEPVTVTGTPQLTLATGSPANTPINYASGSGTTTLTFTYTVAAGNTSADLGYPATSSLALNGGTITDAATNGAALTLPTPGAAGSLDTNKSLVIVGAAPAVSITGINPVGGSGKVRVEGTGENGLPVTVHLCFSAAVAGLPATCTADNASETLTIASVSGGMWLTPQSAALGPGNWSASAIQTDAVGNTATFVFGPVYG